ncbi:hypothetical protein TNCV_4702261 [Trichonephila clavipes]|nr:hypothetical protein TNCV_4702261 [Trichonephila clavipes]
MLSIYTLLQNHGFERSRIPMSEKKLNLQEALDLLPNHPSESSDALTDDTSDGEVLANKCVGIFVTFLR